MVPCYFSASMPSWLEWGFWLSPLSYAEIGLTSNEFFAPMWRKVMNSSETFHILDFFLVWY